MSTVGRFALKVFLWLPICFGIWYFASILFAVPLAATLDAVITGLFPDLVQAVMRNGNTLLAVLRIEAVQSELSTADAGSAMAYAINPLKYGYGVPLYSALVLAIPDDEETGKLGHWLLGMLILFLLQVFGLAAEILKDLAFGMEAARVQMGFSAFGHEMLALAYQLGYLILPSLAPIMIWAGQFRRQVPDLIRS